MSSIVFSYGFFDIDVYERGIESDSFRKYD